MKSSRTRQKAISVISANFNGAAHLASCIDSVARQANIDCEHIIIDGGSSDGSVAILKNAEDKLAYWCSEPDAGIADAMNKGISKASGEWLLFLHADDELLDENVLSKAMDILSTSNARIIGFPILYGSANNRKEIRPRGANLWLTLKTGLLHQGTFIHHSVFDDIGLYDTGFRVAMDYDFFLRSWRMNIPTATCREPIVSWMRDNGISSLRNWPELQKRLDEEQRVQSKYFRNPLQRSLYWLYWTVYRIYKKNMS